MVPKIPATLLLAALALPLAAGAGEATAPKSWFALHDMTEQDLKAIYQYVKVLGPAGEPAPLYVPPNQEPKGPYVQFPAPPK